MNYYFRFLLFLLFTTFIGCSADKNQFDASGNFETDEVIISAEASGKIMKLQLEEGENIKSGQQIGYIDSLAFYLQKEQLRANIGAILSKEPQTNIQLQVIKEQIKKAEKEQKRLNNLSIQDAIRSKDIDDINSQLEVLKKQYDAELSTLNTTTHSLVDETYPVKFQIKLLEDQLRKCKIVNPINGMVLTKYALQDEITIIGKPLYKIANLDTMTLRAYITGDQLSQIKLDQEGKIFVDNGAKQYKELGGTIQWISEKSEFTPKTIQTKDERANLVYAIKIRVKNDGFLKIGMYGEVLFK